MIMAFLMKKAKAKDLLLTGRKLIKNGIKAGACTNIPTEAEPHSRATCILGYNL